MTVKRVVIIGAGVVGLCAAYYAARKGFHVTVVDGGPEGKEGCSYGNAGMVVPSHFMPLAAPGMVALGLKWMWNPESPFYVKPSLNPELLAWAWKFWRAANPEQVRRAAPLLRDLSFASRACFEELARGHDFGFTEKGLLMLCRSEHALEEEGAFAEKARALGVPAEVLDARQAAAMEPDIRMDVAGAIFFPKDCHLSPDRFMAFLKGELGTLGVAIQWNTPVTGFAAEGRTIKAANADIEGDEFVIAGGAWSPTLAAQVGVNIPMQAGKGYSLTLRSPRQLPKLCAILTEARVAVTPMGETLRFGGTMEIAGRNEEINPVRVRGIIKSSLKYYPDFTAEDFAGVKPWCGLRPCSPDGLPYLGRAGRHDNLVIATGHAMMGLSLGPVTGQLVAGILAGETPAHDLSLLAPDRF